MKTVSISDFSETIYYGIECPYCGNYIETQNDPQYEDVIDCEGCYRDIEITA